MTFGNIIRKARVNCELSQEQLAKELNDEFHTSISKSMISRWEHGTDIQMSYVRILAKYFKMSPSEILGPDLTALSPTRLAEIEQQLSPSNQQKLHGYANQLLQAEKKIIPLDANKNRVQILGTVSAGTGQYLLDADPEWESFTGHMTPHDYAVRISGDSMAPRFADQQVILVKRTNQVHSGEIIIANYDQQAYVKQYVDDKNGRRLVSLNPKYADLPINDQHEVTILGQVVE
ncbi:helix-turn-helix domain-containing protein [Convivina intestini]|uniref:helix-turn-helix domain-containing protein n=1 Tax=Convivina intestini TaxID=1505726 RepID=UPI00200C084A|nr:XRE family transcriptional regulator [Convivina intestini]CAH1853515.1 LexA repressor [Convivina intestini]